MQIKKQARKSLHNLSYLPSFAEYIYTHRLREYIDVQIRLSREMNIPLLKLLKDLSEEQLVNLSLKTSSEFLSYLMQNKAEEQIENGLKSWLANRLPVLDKSDIAAEDITLISYIRKQSFLHFIPDFCRNSEQMISLVSEIDLFCLESETRSSNIYIGLLKERIEDHLLTIEKINNTTPGAIYVFDVDRYEGIYSNNKLSQIIGYDHNELNLYKTDATAQLIHPDDQELIRKNLERLFRANDGEIISYNYRIKDKEGKYRWLRTYESVFKRHEDGRVWQTIGIALNIDEEKRTADALAYREQQLLEAQEIGQMGSFYWDFENKSSGGSPKTFEILECGPNDFDNFIKRVFPGDRIAVEKAIQESLETGTFDCEYRIVGNEKIKTVWARGIVNYKDGKPQGLTGTILDITEKKDLIVQLKNKEQLYQQAEEIANMGTWTWDISTDKLEWTDQLYKIYGLDPHAEEMTMEKFISMVHPQDREYVNKGVALLKNENFHDYTFRIITKSGETKTLHSIARLHNDKNGNAVYVVGTERDITEKQSLVDQLRNSENLYKQAQSLAHVGNWTWDVNLNELKWSDELYRIYGLDPQSEKISYERYLSFIHPEDKDRVVTQIMKSSSTNDHWTFTHRIIQKGGKIRFIYGTGEAITDDKGLVSMMVGTAQDITEQHLTRLELEENQKFIRKITDATPSIISSYNVNTGKYVFISEGLEKLLGYKIEEIADKGVEFFVGIVHPSDLEEMINKNTAILKEANEQPERNDIIAEFMYRMRHKDGHYRWFHTYGTIFDRDSEKKVEHILNITLDVTDQVEATEKIKEQEHFIQQIADASPTILYLFDVTSQSVVYINREIFFVLGYLPEEIIEAGADITQDIYHPDDFPLLPGRQQSGKSFQQVDSMIQYECRMKNKEGEWRWLLVREIVFKTGENGQIIQILGAALDINRRKEMEKTILQNTILLEQSNASLEEFAYVASHDLKEPLRKISTFGDRLVASQSSNLNPEGKIYLNKIVDASQRMQTMISDLLSISMISGNISFEYYSLQKVLDDTLQTLEYKIEQLNAVIKSDPLPEANIIVSQFRQLFQNLLSNSLKFVKEGTQPIIQIHCTVLNNDELVHYQLTPAKNYLKIDFIDNGIGFENEFAGKIFAIFQRLHGRSEYEGSGIGLAICKKIVEHHGGIIFAKGVPDAGSTFTIILPS